MDGLISSFQQYANRFNAFNHNHESSKDDDKAKNKNPNSTNTHADKTTASTLIGKNYDITDREGQGGNQGGQNSNTSSNKVQNSGNIQFGGLVGDAIAREAIVDAALKVVQGVRDTLLEEFHKALGVPSDKSNAEQSLSTSVLTNEMSLTFDATLVSGGQSQQVSVNIMFSQSFVQSNFLAALQGQELGISSTSVNLNISSLMAQIDSKGASLSSMDFTLNMNITHIQGNIQTTGPDALTSVSLIDPLVIDLGGDGVELSTDRFEFDLDSDGTSDQISMPTGNSGFLALDKNGDGRINNGNELFGTKSGDGFKDLMAYDSNHDGKIDKNDPIFDKLRIWKPDNQGNGKLIGLGEVGIGAIYLNAQRNEQLFEGASGEVLGVQRKTAAYERTDGSIGGIHHIDLAKRQANTKTDETDHINKQRGLAAYKQSQDELNRLRFLNNRPTDQENHERILEHYAQMGSVLGKENMGLLNTAQEKIAQKIDAIKKGDISEEDLAMIQLDNLLSQNSSHQSALLSILDSTIFNGQVSQINSSLFQYDALVHAQRLLG